MSAPEVVLSTLEGAKEVRLTLADGRVVFATVVRAPGGSYPRVCVRPWGCMFSVVYELTSIRSACTASVGFREFQTICKEQRSRFGGVR
jgi:hypothetical protein